MVTNWDESPRSGYFLGLSDTTNNKVKAGLGFDTDGSYYLLESSSVLSNDQWYLLTFTYDGSVGRLYLNGAQDNSSSNSTNPRYLATNRLRIGSLYYSHCCTTQYFNGLVDEVRVSTVARSADWIATEFSNQNNSSTFYSIGPAQ